MELKRSSGMLVTTYMTTQQNNTEEHCRQIPQHNNFKSQIIHLVWEPVNVSEDIERNQ
jgi:hypothetical protein